MSQVSAMQSMQSSMQASAIMSGTSLIGRSILAPGSQATLATGGAIGGAVTAPAGTSNLTWYTSELRSARGWRQAWSPQIARLYGWQALQFDGGA